VNGRVFVFTVAACALVAFGAVAFVLLRKAQPTLENELDHPFGDPTVATTEADRAALLILNGAEKASKRRMPETAIRFYEDVDLRFAHTNVYARYAPVIWDEMTKGHAASGTGTEAVARYIAGRKALHERWLKLKAGPRAKPELEAFLKELPPDDGRRPQVEAWLAE
jgi:hypothetical protein